MQGNKELISIAYSPLLAESSFMFVLPCDNTGLLIYFLAIELFQLRALLHTLQNKNISYRYSNGSIGAVLTTRR